MDWQEAIDGFRTLIGMCYEAEIKPLDARIQTPFPPEDDYGIRIQLAPEGESDPDTVTKVTVLLMRLEQTGKELGFHTRPSMYYILLTA